MKTACLRKTHLNLQFNRIITELSNNNLLATASHLQIVDKVSSTTIAECLTLISKILNRCLVKITSTKME